MTHKGLHIYINALFPHFLSSHKLASNNARNLAKFIFMRFIKHRRKWNCSKNFVKMNLRILRMKYDDLTKNSSNWFYRTTYCITSRGLVYTGSGGAAAAAPPDFENPKKLSHKNAIKLEFSEKWGKIGHLAPPDFWSSRGPWVVCRCVVKD